MRSIVITLLCLFISSLSMYSQEMPAPENTAEVEDSSPSASIDEQMEAMAMETVEKDTVEMETVEIETAEKDTVEMETMEMKTDEKGTAEMETAEMETDEKGTTEMGTVEMETDEKGTSETETVEMETDEKGTTEMGTVEMETDEKGTSETETVEMETEMKEGETADEEIAPLSSGLAVNFVQNSVGGFFPVFLGHINLKNRLNATWYSVFWTNPSFGTLEVGGDLWLETGAGLGFSSADGKLYVNPSIGFTHGKFLSGGEKTVIGDGIVPSILTLYNNDWFEFEFYLAYYKSLRKEGPATRDFILNWAAPGIKVSKAFSLGAFYEQFVLTRATEGEAHSIYQWLGPYIKVPVGNGHFLRFAGGKNLANQEATGNEFYKISAFINLK